MVPSPADRLAPGRVSVAHGSRRARLPRRAVDAVFRGCAVIVLPGYSRPLIGVEDYRAYIEAHTFRGDRVRPT